MGDIIKALLHFKGLDFVRLAAIPYCDWNWTVITALRFYFCL